MTELHLCIATGQNAANLIPLKQLQAQEVWILETPAMKAIHSGTDLKTALTHYVNVIKRKDFDDATPRTIKASALALANALDGRDVVFHVTGGTKLMVLAIHEQLKLLESGSGSLRVLYADTQHQVLDWLDESLRQEPMADVLTLNDLLLLRGYRSANDTRHAKAQQRAAARAKLTKEMGENAASYGGFFSALATIANRAAEANSLSQTFDFAPGGAGAKLLKLAAGEQLVKWNAGQSAITFASADSARYFAGDWTEEYVFLKMSGQFAIGQFAIDISVEQARSKTPNQFDCMAVHRNRALIVECKSSRQYKAQDSIYKLGQLVRQVGGLMAKGLYVSAQQVSDEGRQRAKEYGIDVLAGDELRQVSQYLRDWKVQ